MTKSIDRKNGIVLAMFGTSIEEALSGVLNIRDRMAARFPQTPVRIAFTSKIILRVWRERAAESGYRSLHPDVPEDILRVQDPLSVMIDLQKEGIDSFVVQPVQIAPVRKGVNPWASLTGFEVLQAGEFQSVSGHKVVFGRPALGTYGPECPYAEDIVTAVRSLFQDAALARQERAALLYMGHGNKKHATSTVYGELVVEMRRQYPDILTVMDLVEEDLSIDRAVDTLRKGNVDKIVLKPFMIVAGNHVRKEMVGDGPASLQALLEGEGFTVVPICRGLGEEDAFADIFVQHAADAASDGGIELR